MPAPVEVVDTLEAIVDVYLSSVRHRERAAFMLADNLVELACKLKAKQHDTNFNMRCNFHDAITAPGCRIPRNLRDRLTTSHQVRNPMQHQSAVSTVSSHYCAQLILDVVDVIDRLWPNTSENQFHAWLKCALRVIRLYSPQGERHKQYRFQEVMKQKTWRNNTRTNIRVNEIQIELGERDFWQLALSSQYWLVDECLNEAGVP